MASLKSSESKESGELKRNVVDSSTVRRKKKKHQEGLEFVAPDGGWGWVVVLACGMSNVSFSDFYILIKILAIMLFFGTFYIMGVQFSTLSLGPNFGLVYKEKFEEWGITQEEYSFMRNLEFAVFNCAGLTSGVLLRKFGFRKMSLIGVCLIGLSLLITSQVTTKTNFTIFYSILGGMGFGFSWPSNALAINTYFKKRRGVATGFFWTATGLTSVLMPQLVSLLMEYTDVHGTVLILAGIALHAIPAALLLQPVHWHGKWVVPEVNETKKEEPETNEEHQAFLDVPLCEEHPHSRCRRTSMRRGQIEGVDDDGDYIVETQSTLGLDMAGPISRHSSRWSLGSAGSPRSHAGHQCEAIGDEEIPVITLTSDVNANENVEKDDKKDCESNAKSNWKRMLGSIVKLFDLTIMKDPKFVFIFVGMTLAYVAEMNFNLFVPFVYAEFGYEKSRVALFMTLMALTDLVTTFTIPFVTDRIKIDPKISYSIGLMISATGRIVLAHTDEFNIIMAATLWLGFGRGLRIVYMALVIPAYVPLHRLPTASGLQMLANGVLFLTIGPLFGYLRDNSESYAASLHSINVLTFTTVALWTSESLVNFCRRRHGKKDSKVNVEIKPSEGD